MTQPNAKVDLTFETGNLRITNVGNNGLIVAVDDRRGEDWPAAHVEHDDAEKLRAWLVPSTKSQPVEPPKLALVTQGFAAWLRVRFPQAGPGWGRQQAFAQEMGVSHVSIWKWIAGHMSPGPEMVVPLAAATGMPTEEIAAMIAVDVQARAARSWANRLDKVKGEVHGKHRS